MNPFDALAARLPRRTVRLRLTALYGALFLLSGAALLTVTITIVLAGGWPAQSSGDDQSIGIGRGTSSTRAHQIAAQEAALTAHQNAAAVNQLLASSAIALAAMTVASVALGWVVAGRVLRPLRAMTEATQLISEENMSQRLAATGPADELKDLADTIDGLLARLQAAFDAQRQFAANASHELRTPLTLTRTLLQMILTDPRPTLEGFRATCEDVLAAGDQQEQLIEALLTLARSQRGLDHREHVDLATITRDLVDACQPDAAERSVAVSASLGKAPVSGDPLLLQRMAGNLIDNAIRHNIPGGKVRVRVTASSRQATLTITNTGPVIRADQATRLLQPFQRLVPGRPADSEGRGLGLSIVAAIARAHQAALAIHPQGGGGLEVEIRLPAAATTVTARPKRYPRQDLALTRSADRPQ
jgi:signal transduction histidine kinase